LDKKKAMTNAINKKPTLGRGEHVSNMRGDPTTRLAGGQLGSKKNRVKEEETWERISSRRRPGILPSDSHQLNREHVAYRGKERSELRGTEEGGPTYTKKNRGAKLKVGWDR